VDLFFVLSGYLIYGGLIRRKPESVRFLRRRLQRIYPTFLVVFGCYLALSVLFPEAGRLRGRTPAGTLLYILENILVLPGVFPIVPIITVAWSLSYEIFSYLGMLVLVVGARLWTWQARTRVLFFTCSWFIYLSLSLTMRRSLVRALMFVVGILLFEALENERFRRQLTRRREFLSLALFGLTLAFAYLLDRRPDLFALLPGWAAGWNLAPGVMVYHGPYKTLAFSISMFWLTAHACAYQGMLSRVFSWLPLRWLGNMSYSYYLVHGVTLQAVALFLTSVVPPAGTDAILFLAALPVAFCTTWITATALFAAVEKPFSLRSAQAPPLRADASAPFRNS
jgi:exopolysaccharide production protein ExoZ